MSSDQALPGEIIQQIASGDPAVSLFGRIGKWLGHAADLDSFHPPDPSRAGRSGVSSVYMIGWRGRLVCKTLYYIGHHEEGSSPWLIPDRLAGASRSF
jgi:hypothetical protein